MLTQRISSTHLRATRYDRKPLEVLDWHEHPNLSFCFVIKGSYGETTRNRTFTCRPGDVVVKGAQVRHLNEFSERGAVCLLLEISEGLLEASGLMEPHFEGPLRDHHLTRIGLELREELLFSDRFSPAMLEGIALQTLASVLRFGRVDSRQQSRMEAVRERLDAGVRAEESMLECLSSQEAAAVRRLFFRTHGCSIKAYALRRRAFRAFDELLSTEHSLAEIAVRCGFYDQAHFTKVFAGLFGITPGRLRARAEHYQTQ